MVEPLGRSYEFGPFVLDAGKRLLRRNGEPVALAPKLLDTLLVLVEHRREVVSKDQLLTRVWGDTVVEEGGLARNISLLRKTLGETPDDHRYIVTVPARGYRFVADVRDGSLDDGPIPNGQSPAVSVTPDRHSTAVRLAVGVIAIVVVAAAAVVIWRSASSSIVRSDWRSSPALIRLTSTSGLNTDPALSPDGTLVAYASDRAQTGNLDIWVQPVRGGNPTRITSAEGDETEPSFSPDGAWMAFSGGETGGIHTVVHWAENRISSCRARVRGRRASHLMANRFSTGSVKRPGLSPLVLKQRTARQGRWRSSRPLAARRALWRASLPPLVTESGRRTVRRFCSWAIGRQDRRNRSTGMSSMQQAEPRCQPARSKQFERRTSKGLRFLARGRCKVWCLRQPMPPRRTCTSFRSPLKPAT